jgi:predicted ATPase
MCGYPDQALQRSHQALALARQHTSAFALNFVLGCTIMLHQYRHEWSLSQEVAEAITALVTDQEIMLQNLRQGSMHQGFALVMQGKGDKGISLMRQELTNTGLPFRPYFLALLAEACEKTDRIEAGLQALAEGFTLVEKWGKHFWEAELHRLKGELLLQRSSDSHPEATACFQQALDVARRQHAKSLELRTATSLSRLWQEQGRRDEVRRLLGDVYGWFTEGFDTGDLQHVRALLDEL